MVKSIFFAPLLLTMVSFSLQAQPGETVMQPAATPLIQPYGKVPAADLELRNCDFEKEANAEVLFDIGSFVDNEFERHVRIKIFNDFGKNEGNIRLDINGTITDLKAETINSENGKIEITPLDKKLIYKQKVDRFHDAYVFAMPNVKPGSVIEYKYKSSFDGIWYFQGTIPTRYSEIHADFQGNTVFKFIPHVKQSFVKDIGKANDFNQTKSLENIPSLPDEPFMGSRQSNLQRVEYNGIFTNYNTWPDIGALISIIIHKDEFMDESFNGEKDIINKAKAFKTNDEKISFIYDTVKNAVKWNGSTSFFPIKPAGSVWENGSGNSAEINWTLYHLLTKAGINCYPMVVSTKRQGKLNPALPGLRMLNNMVIYYPIDSVKSYVLDATNKFNLFNQIPTDDLNTYGLDIDDHTKEYNTIFLENEQPAIQSVFLNADIKANGKMIGTAEANSFSYNRSNAIQRYTTDGREKYLKYLCNNENGTKISNFQIENLRIDSLPLIQKFDFGIDLAGSDDNYIYFNTNLFTQMGKNPFINETRFSDIDFGYRNNLVVNGIYKLPGSYKIDALPKNVTIVMPDESITFKRIIADDDGTVLVKYVLNHKKTLYFQEDYQDVRGFYKKMYELLNEQIVLKKI